MGGLLSLFRNKDLPMAAEGSITNLYDSIKNFDTRYMQPQFKEAKSKEIILLPVSPNNVQNCVEASKHYHAPYGSSVHPNMDHYYHPGRNGKGIAESPGPGYVKETYTYMVLDDLTVEPMSVLSSVAYLEKCGALGVDKVEEKEVVLGESEVLRFLKESFVTKNVLSTVFLGDNSGKHDDYDMLADGLDQTIPLGCSRSFGTW